jgi:hypothetical protein
MTTTVPKGAGRGTAAARTTKAAQRTPLPPKDGSQDRTPAQQASVDTARTAAAKGGSRTKDTSAEFTALNAIPLSERTPAQNRRIKLLANRPENTTYGVEEAAAPVADAKPADRKTPAKKAGKSVPTATAPVAVPDGSPAASKVARLADGAAKSGWALAVQLLDETPVGTLVTLTRDSEKIAVTFSGGALDGQRMPSYSDGGRTVKLRNVSQVLSQMEGGRLAVRPTAQVGARAATKSGAANRGKKAGDGAPRARALPFDPSTATDEEIAEALRGRAVAWLNQISKNVEDAVVAANRIINVRRKNAKTGDMEMVEKTVPSVIKVAPHPSRSTRIVTFTDPQQTGTRSVALDRLLSVG